MTWWGLPARQATFTGRDRVSNAERIGLPSFIGWLVNNGLVAALVASWVITPLMPYLVSWVFESRKPFRNYHPWHDAFRGFMPGDLMLGVAFASAVRQSDGLDFGQHWYNSSTWHLVVICGAVVGGLLARKYLDAPMYDWRQMRSPSKLYHDIMLYGGFGYLLFTVNMAALVGTSWGLWKAVMLASVLAWIICLVYDQQFTTLSHRKALGRKSHPVRWKPIWR